MNISAPGLTRQLAQRAVHVRFADLPPSAVDTVKRGLADFVGVLVAGAREPLVPILRGLLALGSRAADGEASVLAGGGCLRAADAALLNAATGHALDFDDMALDGHPSVVLGSVVLAEAQRVGASGAEAIAAYAAGYEVWATLLRCQDSPLHAKGWHPTAVLGTVAAAAAAARLRGLCPARCATALAIAASMASGVVANFGSMTKPLQVGLAARNGIWAAAFAEAGLSAAPDALEHPAGLLAALSPQGWPRLDVAGDEGGALAIVQGGLNFKLYPVCYAVHRIIDASLQIAGEPGWTLERVERLEVALGRAQLSMLRDEVPIDALQARFSPRFAVACAFLHRRVGLAELTDATVRAEQMQQWMRRVHVRPIDERDASDPLFSPFDEVTARDDGGRALASRRVEVARGHMRNPVGWEVLFDKFRSCMPATAAPCQVLDVFEQLRRLDELPGVDGLSAACAGLLETAAASGR
ncbi:MmgE/PrpD family protein [Verticiella sediminum]|uniref:MmgE/PrpD family protein n=1 Tax=Verticiella sediminum TaxID=1247510 RepID=A0A556ACG5_9BURK|nr:MmgE/PrpD family protein [Verticiella sediminum]TSH90567.1 MmgE/PrpD family protein [Verticiella sediminum]